MQKSKGLIVECCQGDTHTLHGEYKLAECNIIHYVQTAKNLLVVYWISHQITGNDENSLKATHHQNHKQNMS